MFRTLPLVALLTGFAFADFNVMGITKHEIQDAKVYAQDQIYLGKINATAPDTIFITDPSSVKPQRSMYNPDSVYGNRTSDLSAANPEAKRPPYFVSLKDGLRKIWITENPAFSPRITLKELAYIMQ